MERWYYSYTLFTNSKEDAVRVLSSALKFLEDDFDEKNVSYTENINRQNLTKRTTTVVGVPNVGVPKNQYNYEEAIE